MSQYGTNRSTMSTLDKSRATSPDVEVKREKFDFSAFIMLLIKVGIKCYPDIEKSAAVLLVVERSILPLISRMPDDRSVQNSRLSKLIAVANTRVLVDFMSVLFPVVTEDVFMKYAGINQTLNFEGFVNFTRDHDIFPEMLSKAALFRIFHSLSNFSEAINPSVSTRSIRKEMSALDISSMSPRALHTLSSSQGNTIDQNLFVEAITLIALYPDEPEFDKMLRKFTDDLTPTFSHLCLQRCLNLVTRMNNSEGRYAARYGSRQLGQELKAQLKDREHDLLAPFRANARYLWYFKERELAKKRFTPQKPKYNFDSVMLQQ